ncbi:type I methionyl aminopeptidase [Candidatus Curtissbacteria bacterium RBG_13_40_7]|uniref:Methionine aminopeptidase n=1 Tax=Candidatus Curtissbacteria bacterium RBG_13_40_7 TaxID=1797706 RepID=A0A1F5FX70_9BACT|nr:MAG: type I methionyl aminopeptidase [Candidatus Curtissbacteria bacterium RBG_13_40_7]
METKQGKPKVIKTLQEIETMKMSGGICAGVLKKLIANVKSGQTCSALDKIAQSEIEKQKSTPSFMTVEGYKWAICTTLNDQVVHGIPNERKLREGDILGMDLGVCYSGYHSDMAITLPIGEVLLSTEKFLKVGRETLERAIHQAQVGNTIGDISATIQEEIEGAGYSVVKSLTGHGIGRNLHEEPLVPGFGKKGKGTKILKNMTLAIEIIYTQGSGEVVQERDGWTIKSADGSLGGLFEKTVVTSEDGPIVLTPYS